ncbi:MAG: 30S ribosomal protein S30e [Candidatus Heimdallarchaeota archaeon]|nr:30S ribosomal protein S30e [Candidatus Heimdallarchaeota archaeon]MDH5647705.1 30S ribosomal protein S30e [Candidatus Heimdallarchaeota archaeon]
MTHGRLQNAGIVRKRTPKVEKKYPNKSNPIPRLRYRKLFINRHFKNKPAGQTRRRK